MKTNSVYVQGSADTRQMSPKEKVACFASELKTIRELKLLGYTTSCGQSLDARAEELEQEIINIEGPGVYNVKR